MGDMQLYKALLSFYFILSLKDGQASHKTVYASAKVLVVYAPLARVHGDEGISNDIFQERAGVYGAHDEPQ